MRIFDYRLIIPRESLYPMNTHTYGEARDIKIRYFVCENAKPVMAIECQWNDASVSKSLRYFKK